MRLGQVDVKRLKAGVAGSGEINAGKGRDHHADGFSVAMAAGRPPGPEVGEIRDGETAENAIQASLTGHLVFTTLHTNDAPSTISRLVNMGIEPFLVATSVNLIQAQRLIRRICKDCKEEIHVPAEGLGEVGRTLHDEPGDIPTWHEPRDTRVIEDGIEARAAVLDVACEERRARVPAGPIPGPRRSG